MLYKIKGSFQKVGGHRFDWLTPNQATVLGWIATLLLCAGLWLGATDSNYRYLLLFTPLWGFLRMLMNALDGMLARRQGTASPLGEILNEASDIFGDMFCWGVLLFIPISHNAALIDVLLLCLIWSAEFFGVLGKGLPGGNRRHESFIGGKPERTVWISFFALAVYIWPGFLQDASYYLAAVCVLVGLTSLARVRASLVAAKGKSYASYTPYGE